MCVHRNNNNNNNNAQQQQQQQYAATTGVFWTGTDDSGTNSDSPWATTPHVIVAGGIVHVNSSDTSGLYKATDTIDILREVSTATASIATSYYYNQLC
jgi:3D (Asp-Asp-Asp) domain-containing protein